MKTLFLLLSLLWGGLALAQTDLPKPILDAARRAAEADLPQLDMPQSWSHAILSNIKTTALGCSLIGGLKLPAPIEVHRLELHYDDSAYAVHVSADATMAQLCDERFPGLKLGLVASILPTDRDGDTVPDAADSCPTVAGRASAPQPGCPQASANDSDGDGQPDSIDLCPSQAGSVAADGCSLLQDTDGDGVPDIDDICPRDAGITRDDFALGCPKNGSGSSPHRRQPSDVCRVQGERIRLFDSARPDAAVIGIYEDSKAAEVIGRDVDANWYRLSDGWAAASSLDLRGACYNIPIASVTVGLATGCFLRPRGEFANVRNGPATTRPRVATIDPHRLYAALGRSLNGDWLFFNQGWVRRTVLELAGDCSRLPVLDPQQVGSGVIFFCPPAYEGYLPPRIVIGQANARIASSRTPNRLREQPSITAAQIGEIPPGQTLQAVLDGPACQEHFVWWQVQTNGQVGWTAESDVKANVYYLEPVSPETAPSATPSVSQPHPTAFQMITSANAAKVGALHSLPVDAPHSLAWSPASSRLSIIGAAGDIDIYDYPDFENISAAYHLPADLDATAAAFSAADRFLAIGDRGGRVYIAEFEGAGAWLPPSHMNPVRALAWSGNQLASASDSSQGSRSTLKVWHLHDSRPPRRFINYSFPYPLTDLDFSAAGRWLAVTGESSARQQAALWIYDTADGALHFSKALIYSPESGFVISTPDPSLGDFVYGHGDSLYRISVGRAEDIRFYHQPGDILKGLAFRQQVIDGADALFALVSISPNSGAGTVRFVNVLNRSSSTAALPLHPTALAFSPDGRALAVAQADREGALILGVTDPPYMIE